MKKTPKLVFFIVAILILLFTYTSIFGVYGQNGDMKLTYVKGVGDIRWGTDIRGGVEVTFVPADGIDATDEQLAAAEEIIKLRLVNNNITDYELYTDASNDHIIVRFPWNSDEEDFNPESAIEELGSTAQLTFREGDEYETTEIDANGNEVAMVPKGDTAEKIILDGSHVISAKAQMIQDQNTGATEYVVALEFDDEGKEAFAEATDRLTGEIISIWMDDVMISNPVVNEKIPAGKCTISGGTNADGTKGFTPAQASALANKIQAGSLPFELEVKSYSTISPTMGASSLDAMLLAGIIAFILIAVFMILMYRLPGAVAVIALLGHIGLTFAFISGYFGGMNSFTMTLPGISGIILGIGMAVDANVITFTRIKEELWAGRSLDGAIKKGNSSSFWAIFDGNITVIIVAVILMAVFGPSNILSMLFGASTTGSIYSFGYTLLVSVICNFVMSVFCVRMMLRSLSGYKSLRHKWLFGGPRK